MPGQRKAVSAGARWPRDRDRLCRRPFDGVPVRRVATGPLIGLMGRLRPRVRRAGRLIEKVVVEGGNGEGKACQVFAAKTAASTSVPFVGKFRQRFIGNAWSR